MPKLLIALSLAIMVTVIACGGGGPRMTVQEYADACEALGDQLEQDNVSSGISAIEDALDEVKRWNPPEELQEYHDVGVRGMEATVTALKDTGALELFEEMEKAQEEEDVERALELMEQAAELEDELARFDDQMTELTDELERARENLSPATREILDNADCF